MKLWMLCWRYPVVSEVIVVTEFDELMRQGVDGLLIPLQNVAGPALWGDIAPERVMRPTAWPSRRIRQLRLALRCAVRRPLRFALCFLRLLNYVGDDSRGALVTLIQILAATGDQPPPDHVHAHFGGHLAHVASLLAIYYGCPWSTTVHAKDIYLRPDRLATDFLDAKFVRAISQHGYDWVQRYCPYLTAEHVVLIHCGVDTNALQAAETETATGRPIRLIAVGRLVAKKGHDLLIRACAQLRDKGRPIECVIIGDGPERKPLEAMVTDLRLEAKVRLLGAQPRSVVLEHLARSDVMVLACHDAPDGDREGIPLVFIEAMALGKPVVAGQAGGIQELLTQGGTVIPSVNVRNLSEAIDDMLLLSTGERHALGQQGRARVAEAFALHKTMAQLRHWLFTFSPPGNPLTGTPVVTPQSLYSGEKSS